MERMNLQMVASVLLLLMPLVSGASSRIPDGTSMPGADRTMPLQAVLRASDPGAGDGFGSSVSISGTVAIVGSFWEDGGPGDPAIDAGAAYIYRRNRTGAGQWGQVKKLMASDAAGSDWSGTAVAIDGDTAVIGAPEEDGGPADPAAGAGAAYVFQHVDGYGWLFVKTLRASDGQSNDLFGRSVAISGDVVIVGAPEEDGGDGDLIHGTGAAYFFGRDVGGPGNWGQVKKLNAQDMQQADNFGRSVVISGDLAVVGSPLENGGLGNPTIDAGAAYVFEKLGGLGWTQTRKLTAMDAEAADYFGISVAVSGDVIVVGAESEDGGPGSPLTATGAAYIFMRRLGGANSWGQAAKIMAPHADVGDAFGHAVAISGKNALVGALLGDSGAMDTVSQAGTAYVFRVSLWEAFRGN